MAVVGLGYVGLPLAVAFARAGLSVVGFDVNPRRISELSSGLDHTGEVEAATIVRARVEFTDDPVTLGQCQLIIVAVPTPIDTAKMPDLSLLMSASEIVGKHMRKGATIIYESTVYPGATEEECVPTLERTSGFKWKKDFFVGYSPERMNPGDKEHTVEKIVKVVSGDTPATLARVSALYRRVCRAGVHEAPSLKVAEAAKVIENVQRDLNIALMNELAQIFHKLEIDTLDVLTAAGTKWNFLPFRPGLVGGHCIGVDPYYLTHKAATLGHSAEVILAGRSTNDKMGFWVAREVAARVGRAGKSPASARVLIAGLTFKENVSDMRNSRVSDIYRELVVFGFRPMIYDPHADSETVEGEYGCVSTGLRNLRGLDAYILATPHAVLMPKTVGPLLRLLGPQAFVFDLKGALARHRSALLRAGHHYWRM